MLSVGSIFVVDFAYLAMPDATPGNGPMNMAVIPLILFGLGHALLVTL